MSRRKGPAPRCRYYLGSLCVSSVTYRGKYHLDSSLFYRHDRAHSDITTSSSHAHTELRKRTHIQLWCTAEETQDLYSRQLLKSVFLPSPGSGRSEICRRTDNVTAYPAFPNPCPLVVDHHPFHYPGCVHHPLLHSWTSWTGETSLNIL